ncbi:hypothetical protein V498_10343 [Pseudogymnoascus sp. VKM F-4517 (FW-2822)]|nr:hypothetical protein V498_10343 [Pseudogymnoascus sp. VKM F-4517 (FW-2822)]
MSNASAQSNITFVDSVEGLLLLLDSIVNLATEPPSLYIDLEGIALGRRGSISILSLHIAPTKETYLIDIYSLKEAAFSTTNSKGTSLKTVLESPTIPKVIFDIRNDSDALFGLFGVSVDGIKDLQLMELATRMGSRGFLSSLVNCIARESPISAAAKAEWSLTKERGSRLFDPAKGGHYEVFNERPLKSEVVQYCHGDVALLPGLYGVYNAKLRQTGEAFWRVHVRHETKERIKLSQGPSYDARSKGKAVGWDDEHIREQMDDWNDDIMMEHFAGDYVLNENDEWVEASKA